MLYFGAYFLFMIYLAPLQGFTDFVYRNVYAQLFNDVDAFYIPYISIKNNTVLAKYQREVLPENNQDLNVVPQLLPKDKGEMIMLAKFLKEFGYRHINLNLGCPYPMATKRGKGAGLLPFPEKVEAILLAFFQNFDLQLSVKLRLGLNAEKEIEKIIPVLNKFSLKEVILHPRIAKQLYKGKIFNDVFSYTTQTLKHPLAYNGDIFSLEDYNNKKQLFSETENWMLGRGILMNPFLPSEIKGIELSANLKREKLLEMHNMMLKRYLEVMDNEGNALNKMQQFWIYFSHNFPHQHKALKAVKKAKNLNKYKTETRGILAQL